MKRWNTPMNGCSASRGIGCVAGILSESRSGFMASGSGRIGWATSRLRLGRRRLVRRARNRRHRARSDLARLARLRCFDEELRLLDALRRGLRGDAPRAVRVPIEQIAAERALGEAVEEALRVE